MAPTNRQRVEQALDELRDGLHPYFQQLVASRFGQNAWEATMAGSDRFGDAGDNVDLTRLFTIFHEYRNDLFKDVMGRSAVSHMHEAQDVRNRWAHQEQFTTPDTLRSLDTITRLLEVANAPAQLERVQKSHEQVLRSLFAEQTRSETRKHTQNLNSQGDAALVPWRDVATPHEDVRTGNLKEAEFAADLDQVHQGKAGPEYQDPEEFFRRTFLTEGLTNLLASAFNRLHGSGGDPVLELQTNFGGGKTHSMIALYHIASGIDPRSLPGLEPLVHRLGITDPLYVQRAVLVGTKLSVNEPRRKSASVTTRTLWGELAWQLGGEAGYRLVEESDRSGHSPGAQVLQELFDLAGPSLILIDEWVAFVRHLYHSGDTPPAAGSFDANLTFAQALTEAVTNSPQVLLAASLPSSEMEVGGQGGQEALRILQHTFGRVKASWRAASANEGFEIVRRRLFQEITDFRKRDATIRMYLDMYGKSKGQFPTRVHEADYRKRMEAAYPFHPETFDQLFEVWGSLETFQRTRGVLRLMANVVYTLWERKDASPLIMPANIPMDAVGVATEMGSYLPDSWTAVIEHDIDSDNALSLALDRENTNYDKHSATRRVARAIFLGSAPTFRAENKGIDDRSIRLGVVQPGESVAIFGDALRSFADRATYLYSEHGRYWFSTQPSVAQIAQERLSQLPQDDVDHAIVDMLREQQRSRGMFDRVHAAPMTSADVVDTPEASLVLLGPGSSHVRGQMDVNGGQDAGAVSTAQRILDTRGDGRRRFRNALVFLAPDRARLEELHKAVAQQLVWSAIANAREELNLDAQQQRQATSRVDEANRTVAVRFRDTWQWLLAPYSDANPGAPVAWDARQLRSMREDEALAVAASKRAESEQLVIMRYAGTELRREIDGIPRFHDGWTHVATRDLAEWFSTYLYLPRLKDASVLAQAINQGVQSTAWQLDTFAYADSSDDDTGRYRGLTAGGQHNLVVNLHGDAVLVHPEAAQRQIDADEAAKPGRIAPPVDTGGEDNKGIGEGTGRGDTGGGTDREDAPARRKQPTRYFGSVTLDPQELASQVRDISREVVANLQGIYGADVRISLEIQATVPDGIPDDRRRAVIENSKQLKFDQSGFAEE